jgi:ribosomal protein S18 acetylase RimI-like enzyme
MWSLWFSFAVFSEASRNIFTPCFDRNEGSVERNRLPNHCGFFKISLGTRSLRICGMDVNVRSAQSEDLDVIVGILTESFFEDPVMCWAFEESVRPRRLDVMWRVMAKHGYIPAGAATVLPGGDGAALWMPPGRSLDDAFWSEHASEFVGGLEGDLDRISQLGDVMNASHPTVEHWYLLAIGIHPHAQGRGLGGTLLAHTLARADAARQPAYLEATSTRSRALYERFGFEVTGEIRPGDGPPLWCMWREPNG